MASSDKTLISVTYYQRKPQQNNFSIERLFNDIRKGMCNNISYRIHICKYVSRGVFRRLLNCVAAIFDQSDINHITGDVHYLSFLLPKRKTLLTIHDCVSLERLKGTKRHIFYILWYWLPVKRVSIITVVSESTKRELLRYVKCDSSKIRVVLNCISDDFKPAPKKLNRDMPVLLQMGTGYNKNLPRVAEALSGILCHLRIIGNLSKEQTDKLDACGIRYSSVANLTDADIVKEYIKCDALIFVSTYEGFGLPIVEANATGRPVITSNILSMPEVAGNAACLVNPFDINEIRNGVLKVLTDEQYRKSLIDNGYVNAHRFKQTCISNRYLELYNELHLHNS